MAITFDPFKNERNVRERGLPLAMAGRFAWSASDISLSRTQEPTTTLYVAVGKIDGKVCVVVFTSKAAIRASSL